jgi:hypothetical protein
MVLGVQLAVRMLWEPLKQESFHKRAGLLAVELRLRSIPAMTRRAASIFRGVSPMELTDEISGYLLSGQTSHAVIQYSGKIRLAMRDAIIAILVAAGMSASVSEDDMRPLSVALSE